MEEAPPSVVVMDLHPSRMRRGGGGTARALLRRMAALGFSDISHSGPVCDSRWLKMTKGLRCEIAVTSPGEFKQSFGDWQQRLSGDKRQVAGCSGSG